MKWSTGVGLALMAALCLRSSGVGAQDEELAVAVPGIRALDGDDDVAHELTGWLRAGASAVKGWRLHTAVISLEQFMLVHDCHEPSEDCLASIAETLEADRVVSGSLQRIEAEAAEGGYDFEVRLFLFDTRTGHIERTTRARIDRTKGTPEELAVLGQQEVARLAEAPFDQLGQEQATELRLSRDGVPPVQLVGPTADRGDVFPAWPAAVSYTGAAVFFGMTAWSWTTIKSIEQDPSFELARAIAGPQVANVCTAGTNFGVEDLDALCSKANTQETLQWIFLGMGVASVGLGTWLLVKSIKSRRAADRARLELSPIAGKKLGGVSARLEF